MLHTSLRRVARSCPHAPLPPLRSSPTPSHGTITAAFTTHSHQRRNSSSKPPIPPNNGSPPLPAASVKQVGVPRSNSEKRPSAESRSSKRERSGKAGKSERVEVKAKEKDESSNEWTRGLPSVPSTQHLNPKDVYVASFFSTHRPISITGPLPPETSLEDIDKIFVVRSKNQRKAQDVIYTLSSVVQALDAQGEHQHAPAQHEESVIQRADVIKALTQHNQPGGAASPAESNVHHLDGQPQPHNQMRAAGNVKLVIQALARQFRPFHPPPAPTAAPDVEFFEPETEALETSTDAKRETQSGAPQRNVASSNPVQHQDTPSTPHSANSFFTPSFTYVRRTRRGLLLAHHLQHVRDISRRRQNSRRIPGLERIKMYLISVKRQRRLKMKKHKYKKLQRKTRNLRRRQGKI